MYEYTIECLEEKKSECLGSLDEIAREGARRMLAVALQTEVEEYVQQAKHARDDQGHALVVRNVQAQERTVTLGVGPAKIRALRMEHWHLHKYF
jgi:putative transposase